MALLARAQEIVKRAKLDSSHLLPANIRDLTGYAARPLQTELERALRRFNSFALHRRFGKTVLEVNRLIERAVYCPFDEGRYAYLAPTYAMAEDIAWHYLLSYTKNFVGRQVELAKLSIWLPTYRGDRSRIRLYGTDSPKQRLRGLYLDGVVFDEWAHIPPFVWTEQVRPMLSDQNRQGFDDQGNPNQWADFIFTPFGRNHAYRYHRDATLWSQGLAVVRQAGDQQEVIRRNDWNAALYRASETGIISETELRDAFFDMGPSKYEQEFECSFEAAVEGAIYARELEFLRKEGRVSRVPYIPLIPVHTCWDLGHDAATAIWFFQQVGDMVHWIDYFEASGEGLAFYADVLEEKKYLYGRHYLPHDVEVTELGSGKTRAASLRELGIRPSIVPKSNLEDGINATRNMLMRSVFDASACSEGLDRLALYRREKNEKLGTFPKKPVEDWASHGADALRTGAVGVRRRWGRGDPSDSSVGEY